MTTPTLETIVRHNILSLDVEHLRVIAHEQCGIPRDENAFLVDLWLYERLALAANFMGPHFGIADTAQTLQSIECGLTHSEGTFLEKCSSSWAELVANPIVRHEIMLPWSWFNRDFDRKPVVDALANETFSDVFGLLAHRAASQ